MHGYSILFPLHRAIMVGPCQSVKTQSSYTISPGLVGSLGCYHSHGMPWLCDPATVDIWKLESKWRGVRCIVGNCEEVWFHCQGWGYLQHWKPTPWYSSQNWMMGKCSGNLHTSFGALKNMVSFGLTFLDSVARSKVKGPQKLVSGISESKPNLTRSPRHRGLFFTPLNFSESPDLGIFHRFSYWCLAGNGWVAGGCWGLLGVAGMIISDDWDHSRKFPAKH